MKHIKIGAHKVKLSFPHTFTETEDALAQVDYDRKIIRVSSKDSTGQSRPTSAILVSLFHEIFHLIDHNLGYQLFSHCATPEDPEGPVDPFSEALVQILLDNNLLRRAFLNFIDKQGGK